MWDTTTNSTSFLSFPNPSPSPRTFLLHSIHFLYPWQGLSPEFMPFMYFKRPFVFLLVTVCVLVTQSCLTLCDPMDSSPPGFSVHGILQARLLEWVTISFSRGSSGMFYASFLGSVWFIFLLSSLSSVQWVLVVLYNHKNNRWVKNWHNT